MENHEIKPSKTKAEIELHKVISYKLNGEYITSELFFRMPYWKPWMDEADKVLEECLIGLGKVIKMITDENEKTNKANSE